MNAHAPRIDSREFGRLPDGRSIREFTLSNANGMSIAAIEFGGIVTAIRVPDRAGRFDNVVLGFSNLADYVERNPNFGTIVGRFANRIAGGAFELDGRTHHLSVNDGSNTLHGGAVGFGKRRWQGTPIAPSADGGVALQLDLVSDDGDEGFPGRMTVSVRYTLNPDDSWQIDYRATTDRPTPVNLSHHDYFNLAGAGSALDQRLTLAADRYLAIDERLIPTDAVSVAGTPFDFRVATPIGERIRQGDPQLLLARGYDHNWLLDRGSAREGELRFAARLADDASGRVMEIDTSEPGMQFYSGNFLDGRLRGASNAAIRQGDGVCLEPQHFPNSPNRPDFPGTVLRPGEIFTSRTVYRFSVA